ncbi:hypothetical protein KEM52_001590 [Ascosphaera acerosa]|nr:hypothetical protein KEM52_001590 [Ascosphaera acerosa]
MKFAGRTFIISGGSSGLGLATAKALLAQDANVAIFDRQPPPVATDGAGGADDDNGESEDTLPASSASRVLYIEADVTSTASLQAGVDRTVAWTRQAGKPLGGVVTCAGIGYAERALPRQSAEAVAGAAPMRTMSMANFDRVIAVNLRGTVDLIRLALPHIGNTPGEGDDEERGVVVVVSSVAAYEGQVGQLAYSASKAAVAGLVLPLAREVGRTAGIRVVGVAPAVFQTSMTLAPRPVGGSAGGSAEQGKERKGIAAQSGSGSGMIEYPQRMGRPAEFASLVLECIRNPMLNGQVFRIDGAVRFPSRL